ncbi:MAG: hypothetical protein JWM92_373 [Candidatus Nomurabacteria bacterium]|nr:hypothetical protein [Candidatus Nomurabacteria bacterium]
MLISAFLFPVLGHAAAAPVITPKAIESSAQSPATPPVTIVTTDQNAIFQGMLSTLTDLAKRTQTAVDQLGANGIDTADAQTALATAKTSLLKAKTTLTIPKYSPKLAEAQLHDSKISILQALTALKASLSTLTAPDQNTQ